MKEGSYWQNRTYTNKFFWKWTSPSEYEEEVEKLSPAKQILRYSVLGEIDEGNTVILENRPLNVDEEKNRRRIGNWRRYG